MAIEIIAKRKEERADKYVATKQLKFNGIERTYDSGKIVLDDQSDGEQHGQAELTIKREGDHYDVKIKGSFWNGRLFDGDTFVAMGWLMDENGNKIETIRVQRGLDARGPFRGRDRPRTARAWGSIDISAAQFQRINAVVLTLGYHNMVDDQANWIEVFKLAAKAIQELNSSETPASTPPTAG